MKLISIIIILFNLLNADINLNFRDLDIKDFIKMVAKITNKNILITHNIHGKVNFVAVKPIKEKELYPILINVLRSKGYTIVSENGFLKVVKDYDAIKNAPPLKSNISEMHTEIIKINNMPVTKLYSQILYFRSKYGKILTNNEKNILVITDYPKNINTIKTIIKKIDKKEEKSVIFYKIKNLDISLIYNKFTKIANNLFNKRIHHFEIIKSEETNSIILVGKKNIISRLYSILEKLDKKIKTTSTYVIRLKNSDVNNIEKILQKIASTKYKKNPPSITKDIETNSLILIGKAAQIQTLKEIIKQLDIPKQQVYVKARIIEISNLKAASLGAKLGLEGGLASTSGLYTLSANLGGNAFAFDIKNLNIDASILKKGLALGATLDILERFGAAKKLSEPSILSINNTTSTIYVGKTISVKTGQTTSSSTSVSFSRQDIGLTLNIKPRIDSDNKVALSIKAKIEDILPGSPDATLPTTSKREIETTTIVNNAQSIIIGGLVRDNKDISLNKVPVFGDIPIIGSLFRHKSTNYDKTTLVIILTPYIVKNSNDLDKLRETLAKLEKIEKSFANKIIKKIK